MTKFMDWIEIVLDKYFPLKTKWISAKRIKSPWLNKRVLKLITKKHALFSLFKRSVIPYNVFDSYSKLLKKLINKLKNLYYKSLFAEISSDTKHLWKSLNKLLGRSKTGNSVKFINNEAGEIINIPHEVASTFNNYFTSIPTSIQSTLPPSHESYASTVPINDTSIFLINSCMFEVQDICKDMTKSDNKGTPLKFIKLSLTELSIIISDLFNLSLNEAIYPDCLKISRVTPIFKSGSHSHLNNYRPISVTSYVNKIFEKLLFKRLNSFINDCHLLNENQYGFRRSRDTQQATLKLLSAIISSIEDKQYCACVFLDFRKAFDTVDHELLLHKLNRFGIRGVAENLIRSYLSNRKQYVSIDGHTSDLIQCPSIGVPQGGCLSPLLYILYANDLPCVITQGQPVMFADDTSLVISGTTPEQLHTKINEQMHKVYDWCNYNRLSLNISKTKYIIFGFRKVDIPEIVVANDKIECVPTYKYLGFQLDNKLNYDHHIRYLKNRLSTNKFITYKIKSYISSRAAKSFYHAHVQSILTYGICVWGARLLEENGFKKLKKLQNQIVLNLFFKTGDTMIEINKVYKRNNILKLEDLYKLNTCVLAYRILFDNLMPNLLIKFNSFIHLHNHNTRYRSHFRLPMPTVRPIKFNFVYRAAQLWNSLNEETKNSETVKIFKTKLMSVLIEQY